MYVGQKPVALVHKRVAPVQNREGLGGAKDCWETVAPWVQKKTPFAPSPNHVGHF